ncbi:hypothetical protein Rwratislav_44126 [Rhodococcus wratislaviensis IFP 2016]|nr:hypothetical protein Rwratislav_44126 [Rhodococcus wratislaviensis IFP 2016]
MNLIAAGMTRHLDIGGSGRGGGVMISPGLVPVHVWRSSPTEIASGATSDAPPVGVLTPIGMLGQLLVTDVRLGRRRPRDPPGTCGMTAPKTPFES